MTDIFFLLLAFVSGIIAGFFFFGGLWWTINKLVMVKNQNQFLIKSFVIRTLIVLVIVYFVSDDDVFRLFFCMFGFLTMRYIAIRKIQQSPVNAK